MQQLQSPKIELIIELAIRDAIEKRKKGLLIPLEHPKFLELYHNGKAESIYCISKKYASISGIKPNVIEERLFNMYPLYN